MPYALEIILDVEVTNDSVHKFRNFGEEVWKEFRDEVDVSLDVIDQCTDRFEMTEIKSKHLKRVLARLEKIADAHFLSDKLEIRSSRK